MDVRKLKQTNEGITLIALVVTIVVLLILAGITINLVFSDNGIIRKAQEAANKTQEAVKNEQAQMNELADYMTNMLNEIGEGNSSEDITGPNGKPLIETLTEIQTNNNVEAEDKYGNSVTVPKGFKVVASEATTVPEGIVIEDANGNQFVWIPIGIVHKDNNPANDVTIQLGRYTFDKTTGEPTPVQVAYTEENEERYTDLVIIENEYGDSIQEYATRENANGLIDSENHLNDLNAIAKDLEQFVKSVKNNGGYYLARYEASYGSGTSIENWKPLSKISTGTPREENNSTAELTEGMLWNYVTQLEASKISQNMYNGNTNVGVESDLVNSYAWDTAIVFIQKMKNINYANANRNTTGNSQLMNTGTTDDIVCNIYDMAANLGELTTEYCLSKSDDMAITCVGRGGSYNYNNGYTSFRGVAGVTNSNLQSNGFRLVIYLK